MRFEIVYTDNFERELKKLAKKYRSLKNELVSLIDSLEIDPIQGSPLGLDCYKIQVAIKSKGKGKSGGARVITHIYITGRMVYLLSIYDKSEKENISDKELSILISQIK
jgi:mRNA-degrading endonuclease RelE of RelBE toxin-antitoxin system